MIFRLFLIFSVFTFLSTVAQSELGSTQGAISARNLPSPIISKSTVQLDVPHIRQKPDYCVPSSTAMVLKYYGQNHSQSDLKARAENYKPASRQNWTFTYWDDMNHALRQMGYRWSIKNYPKTNQGFSRGLRDIKASLRQGRPVLIEVHQGPGHTFVIMGFDDTKQQVYIRDPNLPSSRARQLSYATLRDNWHNHRFGQNRSAFFSKPSR